MVANKRLFRLGFLSIWVLMAGFGLLVEHKVALADTLPDGYQLTVTESASTIEYSELLPTFTTRLTVPADDPLTLSANFYIMIDNQSVGGPASGLAPMYTIILPGKTLSISQLAIGQHTVVAAYASPKLGQLC